MIVTKLITDDDGSFTKDNTWHLTEDFGGADRIVCNGHVIGEGESSAEFKQKEGKITCPECIKIIKWYKAIKP